MCPSPLASQCPSTRERRHRAVVRARRRRRPARVQLPPSAARTARSARRARWLGSWSMAASRRRDLVVVRPALHGDGALPRLGQHVHGVEHVGQPALPAEALHGGDGDDDGRDLPVLGHGDPPGHVAAQVGEDEVGAQVGQLGPSPRRAGGDQAAGRQAGQRAADEAVAGVGALAAPRRARGAPA